MEIADATTDTYRQTHRHKDPQEDVHKCIHKLGMFLPMHISIYLTIDPVTDPCVFIREMVKRRFRRANEEVDIYSNPCRPEEGGRRGKYP